MKISALWTNMTGKAQHASNYNYDIRKNIYNQLLNDRRLDGGKLLPKVDNPAQKELLDTICTMAGKRAAGQFTQASQVSEVSVFIAANLQYMTTEFLDRIEQIAIASGLLVLAHAVHKRNEELILQHPCTKRFLTKRNAAKLFWSALNNGGDEAAKEILDAVSKYARRDAKQHYLSLCSAMGVAVSHCGLDPESSSGQAPQSLEIPTARSARRRGLRLDDRNDGHKAFAGYVKNKNIAIIGPSSSGADYSGEIKRDFDIIIRTSYGGRDKLPEEQRDLIPRISYYRWFHIKKFFADPAENIDYLADLDFAVLKRRSGQIFNRVQGYTNARYALSIPDFFFFGTPNMIPIILQDLSFFEPARIKVFYANLFLTEAIHDKGYITFTKGTLEHWRSNAKHNLVCQYEYMMHLYKRGLIEADPRLSEILNLGSAGYMAQMEKQENRKSL